MSLSFIQIALSAFISLYSLLFSPVHFVSSCWLLTVVCFSWLFIGDGFFFIVSTSHVCVRSLSWLCHLSVFLRVSSFLSIFGTKILLFFIWWWCCWLLSFTDFYCTSHLAYRQYNKHASKRWNHYLFLLCLWCPWWLWCLWCPRERKYHNVYTLKMPHMRSMLNQMASKCIFTQSVSSFNDINPIHSQTWFSVLSNPLLITIVSRWKMFKQTNGIL